MAQNHERNPTQKNEETDQMAPTVALQNNDGTSQLASTITLQNMVKKHITWIQE